MCPAPGVQGSISFTIESPMIVIDLLYAFFLRFGVTTMNSDSPSVSSLASLLETIGGTLETIETF